MMIKKHFLNSLRWGLRLHGISHFIEVVSAINEEAYITATIAFIFIVIEKIYINFNILITGRKYWNTIQ